MPNSDERWVEVSPSQFDHEKAGLASVYEWLPRESPYRAWTNFEFRDGQGRWHECDLLVLGPAGLYLIELKYYYGVIGGDDRRWRRHGGRFEDSPLLLCRRKAQRLASKLKDAATEWARDKSVDPEKVRAVVPFIQDAVLLHHEQVVSQLSGSAALGLFGLEHAEHTSNLPPLSELVTTPARPGKEIGQNAETILVRLMERIGLVQRREREAGSWVIEEGVVAEGDDWQDWKCAHLADPSRRGRIRFALDTPNATQADRDRRLRLARNEFALARALNHDAILTPEDLVQSDLGVGLVYPDDPAWQRLDLWLAEQSPVPIDTAIALIREIAEGLDYAHQHGIVHRTLGAGSIWVKRRTDDPGALQVQIRDWSFAGRVEASTAGVTTLGRSMLVAPGEAEGERWMVEAFRAPESLWSAMDRPRLDVFSLGALAAFIITGRPPASSAVELRQRLGQAQDGIDIAALGTGASDELRAIVRAATHPAVAKRTASPGDVLAALDDLEAETAPQDEAVPSPLDALPGASLAGGRFVVKKRLGKGSTARGLLVTDLSTQTQTERVLKIALDDAAARRIEAEAEVLRALAGAKFAAGLIEGPIEVDGCTALLLESAGGTTLADELRTGTPVPLDFLQRWGDDLLRAIVELDRFGVDHRDVKPSNLGVRLNPSTRKVHLVLFDFSLTRAAAQEVEAGTPPYRDPFLGEGRRRLFDSAAERYSAAVVLYEMATGHPPVFGDGMSLPSLITDEASIDPNDFVPAGLAHDFAGFFRTALRRDAAQRFDSAQSMHQAWSRIFSTDVTTQAPTDEDDRRAEAATLDTPLEEAGITARGLSALARFQVHTVRDFLLKVDAGHRYQRVAPYTRDHLRQRRAAWEKRLGVTRPISEGALADGLELAVRTLLAACGPEKATTRREIVRLIVGDEGRLDAFASAAVLGQSTATRTPASRAATVLEETLGEWATDDAARAVLDETGRVLDERIAELGGAITLWEAAAAVLDATQEPLRSTPTVRRAAGLVRLALERRRSIRTHGGGADLAAISVRRIDGVVALLGTTPALFDVLQAVGQGAEDLVVRTAGVDASAIVSASTATRELQGTLGAFGDVVTSVVSATPDALSPGRLIRVAADLAPHAAVAATLDLHHVDLPQATAIAETFRGYASAAALNPDELRARVAERFPAVPRLPQRPRLDDLVAESGGDLTWDEPRFGYVAPTASTTTNLSTGHVTIPARGSVGSLRDVPSARLAESVMTRSFLALGVRGQECEVTAGLLAQRYDARVLDVTSLLIEAMKGTAAAYDVDWEVIVEADAEPEGSDDRQNLDRVVVESLPHVWAAIDAEIARGFADAAGPVVLTEVAPLARYGHLGELARWSDVSRPRSRAVWVLAPQGPGSRGPVIDGRPLPLGSPGQYVAFAADWTPPEVVSAAGDGGADRDDAEQGAHA